MNNNTLQEISKSIGRLEGLTESGFKNITDRLDRMNGTIAENIKNIDDLRADNNKIKGKIAGITLLAGTIGAIIGLLLKYLGIIT